MSLLRKGTKHHLQSWIAVPRALRWLLRVSQTPVSGLGGDLCDHQGITDPCQGGADMSGMRVNPILEEFVLEYVRITQTHGNRSLLTRNNIMREFLDMLGPQGMTLPHIKKQITFVMNRRFPKRNPSHSWGSTGATWIIGGTMS